MLFFFNFNYRYAAQPQQGVHGSDLLVFRGRRKFYAVGIAIPQNSPEFISIFTKNRGLPRNSVVVCIRNYESTIPSSSVSDTDPDLKNTVLNWVRGSGFRKLSRINKYVSETPPSCFHVHLRLTYCRPDKNLEISRAQPPPTCPNNGCCLHQKHFARGLINHRLFYVQEPPTYAYLHNMCAYQHIHVLARDRPRRWRAHEGGFRAHEGGSSAHTVGGRGAGA